MQSGTKPEDVPVMPVIAITGHDWKIYYVYLDGMGKDVGVRANTGEGFGDEVWFPTRIIRGPLPFGSTDSMRGIFSILRGLGALASYGIEQVWPWMEANVLTQD